MTDNGRPQPDAARARILHISDLHFGWGFDQDSWRGLCDLAALTLKPNLVLITGDLVNSPHRLSLRRALREVRGLKERLGCEVIVVPGNHDTRVLGLLPVKWLNPFALAALSGAAWAAYFLAKWPSTSGRLWLLLSGALTALFVLRLAIADFGKTFKEYLLRPPACYRGLGLEIYAFDSATEALSAARGKVPKWQFVDKRGQRRPEAVAGAADGDGAAPGGGGASAPPYRIAILHHHPLPIPYDHANESLMVVENAGSFLSEVSRLGVRLVLHGHKHHRHFSRTTINAGDGREHEVAVISAGTPTRRGEEQHFNFLLLDAMGSIRFKPYVARGDATFISRDEDECEVELPGAVERAHYEGLVSACGMYYDSNVVTVELTADGDMSFTEEFRGFRVLRDEPARADELWFVKYYTDTGHIDDFVFDNLDKNPQVRVSLAETKRSLTERAGTVTFRPEVTPAHEPLDFYCRHHSLNSFAMSVGQHRQMYGDGVERVEHLRHTLQPLPVAALDIIIKFPAGFEIAGRPRLMIYEGASPSPAYERKYGGFLKYYPSVNVAVARIEHPPLNLAFDVSWALTDDTPPGLAPVSVMNKVDEVARKLLAAPDDPVLTERLGDLLEAIGDLVRAAFRLEAHDELELSLMAYDRGERRLRIVAANFPLSAVMRDFKLGYGNGIAGRAYKVNKGRMFIKRLAIEKQTPSYYYPLDNKPYDLRHDTDIQEVIIALPLRHPGDEGLIYAVLNISSRDPASKLQNIKERRIAEETSAFRIAVDETCLDILSDLL